MPALLVHLDVSFHDKPEESLDSDTLYGTIWLVEILIQAAYVWVICPLLIIYYEGNEKHTIKQRIIKAIKTQMPVFLVLIFFTVITYLFMNHSFVPAALGKKVLGRDPNYTDPSLKDKDG